MEKSFKSLLFCVSILLFAGVAHLVGSVNSSFYLRSNAKSALQLSIFAPISFMGKNHPTAQIGNGPVLDFGTRIKSPNYFAGMGSPMFSMPAR